MRVVASQLIDEPKQPVALLVSTWLDLDPLVIISLYVSRFSLEEAIKEARLVIGWGSEAARKSEVREKWRRLTWIANSWMGCLARNQPASVRKLIKDPWRKDRHRTTLGEIRLALLVERITGRRILVPFGLASDVDKNCFQPRTARISTSHQPLVKAVRSALDAAQRSTHSLLEVIVSCSQFIYLSSVPILYPKLQFINLVEKKISKRG